MRLHEKEERELCHWKMSAYESPRAFSMQTILYKLGEGRVFWTKLTKYRAYFEQAHTLLELGAGQGWASALLKHIYPEKKVYSSDMSSDAVAVMSHWEAFLHVVFDKKIICKSYHIPLGDESVDMIFCYASAHHFVVHEETFREIYRVLKKGGTVLYLHEPSCRKSIHWLAYWRVNKKRPSVPEDVLICADMVKYAKNAGFNEVEYSHDPTHINREPLEGVYYMVLQRVSFLRKLLPCTVDYRFTKH